MRIKATPSDLPFKSTGFATYPVPPQFGQSSGLTPLSPSVDRIVRELAAQLTEVCVVLRIPNKNRSSV